MKAKEESSPNEGRVRRKSSRNDQSPPRKQSVKSDELKQKSDAAKNLLKKNQPDNLDRQIIKYEEEQAIKRDSASDLFEFQETCENIEKIVTEMNDMKQGGVSSEDPDLLDKRLDAIVLTTNLKKLNRYAQIRGKKAKESTLEVKSKVDELHLDLQNLLYEVMHMKKEIQKCMNFSSKDEEIDLVSVDAFYEEAPQDISKPDLTKTDSHQQMLARLDWELRKRKELVQQKDDLKHQKREQEEDIVKKTDYLNSLKPRLEEIIKATKPVQEYMNLPIEAERRLFDTAQYLPRPLYVLYIQAKAYRDVCAKSIEVTIEGDIQLAKTEFHSDDTHSDIESDSEIEIIDNGENNDTENNRNRRNKEKDKARVEDNQKRMLQRHPLSVAITISKKDRYEIVLNFHYLPILHIATVEVKLSIKDANVTDRVSDLLSADRVLSDLLSTDNGKSSPNSANKYQLEKFVMNPFSFYIHQVGHPYFWVQWICGLNYLPDQEIKSYTPDSCISASHFQSVTKAIKRRLEARLSLQSQLEKLESLTIPNVKDSTSNIFPCKVVCMLTSWRKLPVEELQKSPRYEELEELNMVSEDSPIYEATLTREETLKVVIILHSDYPKQPPLMLLHVDQDFSQSVTLKTDLRCLECELNVYTDELLEYGPRNMMLSLMLRKLQVCFDMFVETGPKYTTKEKLYTRRMRGRDRNRPYKYHRDNYFVHR